LIDSEQELVLRCQAGDEAAWATLYRNHAARVARFLQRVIGHDAHTEDMVQQVFVEVFHSIDRFQGSSRLTTWLYGIARNVACKHVRTESRHRRRVDALAAESLGERHDLGEQMEARAELEAIQKAVYDLDEKHRVVWVMRELEGLSTEEVGEALGLNEGTVRSRLFHARKRVLDALEAHETQARERAEARLARSTPAREEVAR
jgi:RNA polymerase sigma-70 factor (ECF subfamily)